MKSSGLEGWEKDTRVEEQMKIGKSLVEKYNNRKREERKEETCQACTRQVFDHLVDLQIIFEHIASKGDHCFSALGQRAPLKDDGED